MASITHLHIDPAVEDLVEEFDQGRFSGVVVRLAGEVQPVNVAKQVSPQDHVHMDGPSVLELEAQAPVPHLLDVTPLQGVRSARVEQVRLQKGCHAVVHVQCQNRLHRTQLLLVLDVQHGIVQDVRLLGRGQSDEHVRRAAFLSAQVLELLSLTVPVHLEGWHVRSDFF